MQWGKEFWAMILETSTDRSRLHASLSISYEMGRMSCSLEELATYVVHCFLIMLTISRQGFALTLYIRRLNILSLFVTPCMKRYQMVEMELLVWWYQGIQQNKNHSKIPSTF